MSDDLRGILQRMDKEYSRLRRLFVNLVVEADPSNEGFLEPEDLPAPAEFPTIPRQTRDCFDKELMPEIERFLSMGLSVKDVHAYVSELIDTAFAQENPKFLKLLKHYQNADQDDTDYAKALHDVLDEWAEVTEATPDPVE